MKLTKNEVNLMLWEIDENLDRQITYPEFLNMYKKCMMVEQNLEPKSLF